MRVTGLLVLCTIKCLASANKVYSYIHSVTLILDARLAILQIVRVCSLSESVCVFECVLKRKISFNNKPSQGSFSKVYGNSAFGILFF